mmetsp:Transcript_60191/g.107014  ORF Transcript_60191/g.107014 Transcript_60191/m.107014 type:complete len:125 (-) Transcript_60191:51-425(-)
MVSAGPRVLLQTVLSVIIVLVHVWTHERFMNMATPVLLGFAYIAVCLAGLQLLGQDVPNMLRSWSLAVVGIRSWKFVWTSCLGTICGSLVAVCLDWILFGSSKDSSTFEDNSDSDDSVDSTTEY